MGLNLPIQSNRNLGGLAAIFYVLGAVSSITTVLLFTFPSTTSTLLGLVSSLIGLLGFAGFIMFLIAMNGFAKDYQERRIWDYITTGIVLTIIVAVIAVVLMLGFVFLFLISASNFNSAAVPAYLAWVLPIFSLIGLIYLVYVVRALNLLGAKSEVPLFKTGAKVLLAGAIVNIAFTVLVAVMSPFLHLTSDSLSVISVPGTIVQDVGWVLLAMAFFRIQALAPTQTATTPPPPATWGPNKTCPNCATTNPVDAIYCTHCGQRL